MKYLLTFLFLGLFVFCGAQTTVRFESESSYDSRINDSLYISTFILSEIPDSAFYIEIDIIDVHQGLLLGSFEYNLNNPELFMSGTAIVSDGESYHLFIGKYLKAFIQNEYNLRVLKQDRSILFYTSGTLNP